MVEFNIIVDIRGNGTVTVVSGRGTETLSGTTSRTYDQFDNINYTANPGENSIFISFDIDGNVTTLPNRSISSLTSNKNIIVTFGTSTPKYRCSSGNCLRDDVNGTFENDNCDNTCVTQKKYKCIQGICTEDPTGEYFENTCLNKCVPPVKNIIKINTPLVCDGSSHDLKVYKNDELKESGTIKLVNCPPTPYTVLNEMLPRNYIDLTTDDVYVNNILVSSPDAQKYKCIDNICKKDSTGTFFDDKCGSTCLSSEKENNILLYGLIGLGALYILTRNKSQ